MASERVFYKTVITTVVLSEYRVDDLSTVAILLQEKEFGDLATVSDRTKGSEEIDGPTVATLLIEQEKDPELFELDEEGNDLDA